MRSTLRRSGRSAHMLWNPLNQQYREPDTAFFFDPDGDTAQGITIASGAPGALLNQKDANAPTIVAGKYRKGITPGADPGALWMPMAGVLPTQEWTIEFWVNPTVDLSTMTNQEPLFIGSSDLRHYVMFKITASTIQVVFRHSQNPANLNYGPNCSFTITNGQFPAAIPVSIAATLSSGAITLYVNGTQVKQSTGIVTPNVWGDTITKDGVTIGWGLDGTASKFSYISDVRVSRTARVPNTLASNVSDQSIITVSGTASGSIPKLNGMLKPLNWNNLPLAGGTTLQQATPAISAIRCDKLISATPIVAGGTDATHPNAGHSGSFAYDWQAVDRELALYTAYGVELYVSADGNPSILGGTGNAVPYTNTAMTTSGAQQPDVSGSLLCTSSTAALTAQKEFFYGGNHYSYGAVSGNSVTGVTLLSGTAGLTIPNGVTVNFGFLTGDYPFNSAFPTGPPNNASSFATLLTDLAYHVITEQGCSAPYWSIWNEPDGSTFWETSSTAVTDYLRLYAACASALKTLFPSIKVGGPEVANMVDKVWVQHLIYFCGTLPQPTGLSASTQTATPTGPRTFNGSTPWFYKIVFYNNTGNSIGSAEVSATPTAAQTVKLQWTAAVGATQIKVFAAGSTGGETGATQLLATLDGSVTTYTDTGTALTTGSIPTSAVANTTPLDFVSWHYYSDTLGDVAYFPLQVAAWATTVGISTPECALGEASWAQAGGINVGAGFYPWCQPGGASNSSNIPPAPQNYTTDYSVNDWAAARVAANLIVARQSGYTRLFVYRGGGGTIIDSTSNPQAIWNVLRMWQMTVGNGILTVNARGTHTVDPGLYYEASQDGGGKVYVFIANRHNRKLKPSYPVQVDVSALGKTNQSVTAYIVDDQHSNAYDTGGSSTALATMTVPALSSGKTQFSLRPRAAALLVIS